VKRALLLAVAAVILVAGCGGDDNEATPTETATVTLPATTTGKVYWLRDGKVWPVARELQATDSADAALAALIRGPNADEKEIGLTTAIPENATVSVSDSGELAVDGLGEPFDAALAQIVYTLTQFPSVKSIKYEGQRYTRADFEDQTPAILVESPLPFADVSSPIRATGTANTFEATFNYELTDTDGKIVDENFVTATSGTGTRGTFDFTTKKFTVPFDGVGSLVVFERSAEDGSRTKLVEIPLRMSQ
jgi:Immunoglobulin-like domain of bacterial spore germination/Sporulation and spore germination